MKKLTGAVLFLAVANLLAVAGLVVWLWASDRLNMDRLREVRAVLAPTITQVKAERAAQEAKAKEDAAKAAELARRSGPPLGVEERIELSAQQRELLAQQEARAREEARQVQVQLDARRAELAEMSRRLEQAEREFAESRKRAQQEADDEQFKLAVAALEAQRPRDAAGVLMTLLGADAGAGGGSLGGAGMAPAAAQMDLAVRYLLGMQDRTRTKVIAEVYKQDPRLATQLLEGIRLKGAATLATPGGPDVDPTTQPR